MQQMQAGVAGTGDDAVHWKKPDARKKEMKKYLADYLKRRGREKSKEETRDAKDYGTNVMFLLERFSN